MDINNSSNNDLTISRVKIGDKLYLLKDAELREKINTLGSAATKDIADNISHNSAGLTTGAQVYDFVSNQITLYLGALHFIGVSTVDPTSGKKPIVNGHTNNYHAGDIVLYGAIEYIYDGKLWHEIKDEGIWIPKSRKIAGISLNNDISINELQTALNINNNNEIIIDDYVKNIVGAEYTPSGEIIASVDSHKSCATIVAEPYTPTGIVSISKKQASTVSYQNVDSIKISTFEPNYGQNANYTPAGNVTVTNIEVTPSLGNASHVIDVGTEYQITDGEVKKLADNKDSFAINGVTVAVGEGDEAETLIFNIAQTKQAVISSGEILYTKPTLIGSLPHFEDVAVLTGIKNTSAEASFTGTGAIISATANKSLANAIVTDAVYEAGFTGTATANIKVTEVNYDKTDINNITFNGVTSIITPTLTKGEKKVIITSDT